MFHVRRRLVTAPTNSTGSISSSDHRRRDFVFPGSAVEPFHPV